MPKTYQKPNYLIMNNRSFIVATFDTEQEVKDYMKANNYPRAIVMMPDFNCKTSSEYAFDAFYESCDALVKTFANVVKSIINKLFGF